MTSRLLPQSLNSYTQASVAFVTLTLTVLLIFGLHLSNISKFLKEKIPFILELTQDSKTSDYPEVITLLEAQSGVKKATIELQTKQEAFRLMLPDDEVPADESNPFSDLIFFQLESDSYTPDYIRELQGYLEDHASVRALLHQEQNFDLIKRNLNRLLIIGTLMTGILFLFALFFVIGSIRYSLHQERERIHTMQIVGARKSFIWQPLRRSTLTKTFRALLVSDIIVILIIGVLIIAYPFTREYLSITKVIGSIAITNIAMIAAISITTFAELTRYLDVNFYELD